MLNTDQEPPIVGFSSADEISGDAQAPDLGVFTAWQCHDSCYRLNLANSVTYMYLCLCSKR